MESSAQAEGSSRIAHFRKEVMFSGLQETVGESVHCGGGCQLGRRVVGSRTSAIAEQLTCKDPRRP